MSPLLQSVEPQRCDYPASTGVVEEMISAARNTVADFIDRECVRRGPGPRAEANDPRLLVPRLLLRAYRYPPMCVATLPWAQELGAVLSQVPNDTGFACGAARLGDMTLMQMDASLARTIHEERHYIGSFHDGIHLGLFACGQSEMDPVSLVTLSEMDVKAIATLISPASFEETLMVSRVYSNCTAPRNTLSYMLGRVRDWVSRERSTVKMLVTYCDPNLGFSGSSYRAANWVPIGREEKAAYTYIDGEYVTNREMKRRYGTYSVAHLVRLLGDRFKLSQVPLKPLNLYAQHVGN